MFVTGYALTDISDKYHYAGHGNLSWTAENCSCVRVSDSPYHLKPSYVSRKVFITFGRYAILCLGIFSLTIEVSGFFYF